MLGLTLREPLEQLGAELVERFGYLGIAAGVLAADMLTFPLPVDVYLLVGIAAGAPPVLVIATASAASILGGVGAFGIGYWLGRTRWVSARVTHFRARWGTLVERWGIVAVVLAALTPTPFSIVCYLAGTLRLRLPSFCLAVLCRIPRIAGYYFLIKLGWTA